MDNITQGNSTTPGLVKCDHAGECGPCHHADEHKPTGWRGLLCTSTPCRTAVHGVCIPVEPVLVQCSRANECLAKGCIHMTPHDPSQCTSGGCIFGQHNDIVPAHCIPVESEPTGGDMRVLLNHNEDSCLKNADGTRANAAGVDVAQLLGRSVAEPPNYSAMWTRLKCELQVMQEKGCRSVDPVFVLRFMDYIEMVEEAK